MPGILGLILAYLVPHESIVFGLWAFLTLVLIDTGHAYATLWRVGLKNDRVWYWLWFPCIVLGSFLWMWSELPGFWTFVVYFTAFHHVKQFVGVHAWYEHRNQKFRPSSRRYLLLLLTFPILLFHFRDGVSYSVYTQRDVFFFPNELAFKLGLVVYSLIWFAFALSEIRNYSRGGRKLEFNRLASVLIPATFHGVCFLMGRSLAEVAFPLLIMHGLTYIALVSHSMKGLWPRAKTLSFSKVFFLILLSGGFLAVLESWSEDALSIFDYTSGNASVSSLVASSLLIGPTLFHYLVDGKIWRRTDPDMARILTH